jgi:hypothetical protein
MTNSDTMVKETDQIQNSRLNISLEKHFDKVIADLDAKITQRFDLMQLAVTKAEIASNERADKANEWREQYNQQEKVLLRKDEYAVKEQLITSKVNNVDNKVTSLSKLVYVGLGIWFVLQLIIGAGLAIILK